MSEGPDPVLVSLLRAAASQRRDLTLASFNRRHVDWIVENALGPLLHYATADDPDRERSPFWSAILSADLTARIQASEQEDAIVAILDRCSGTAPLVLLKGASIAYEHYSEPHLRPMRDLDILVSGNHFEAVEDALIQLGYKRRRANELSHPAGHHHGVPLWHPHTGTWVEVHRSLVPATSPVAAETAFRPETVRSETRLCEFMGRPARRLSVELQILYLTCHWVRRIPIPGGMVALVDLSLLLERETPDWRRILRWSEQPASAARLWLALSYLDRVHLAEVPPAVLSRLAGSQRTLGRAHRALLHRSIDRYVVEGAGFRWPVSEAVFRTLWEDLLRPRPAWRNVIGLGRYGIPRRLRSDRTS